MYDSFNGCPFAVLQKLQRCLALELLPFNSLFIALLGVRRAFSPIDRFDWLKPVSVLFLKGEGTVDRDTVASNCSTVDCLSDFNKRISSKSSN